MNFIEESIMTTSKKVLSLQDKKEIIKALDEGAGQSGIKTAMAKTFGIGNSYH